MKTKEELRQFFKQKRQDIPPIRREEVNRMVVSYFTSTIASYPVILSFASFGEEIDLWPLNNLLLKQKKLVFPRVEGDRLGLYFVDNLNNLKASPWGILEPDPKMCARCPPGSVSYALIPGVAFDRFRHRIGYGRGYFDKVIPFLSHAKKIGIGFKEQFYEGSLSIESHDQALDEIILL